jgi:hypothetical protein
VVIRASFLQTYHLFSTLPPVKPLQPPDSMHLTAAQGWLELGNHEEAFEELEQIDAPLRGHPDVLEVRKLELGFVMGNSERRW